MCIKLNHIYPDVEEKDQPSVGNHRHIICHIILNPAAVDKLTKCYGAKDREGNTADNVLV